MYMPEDIQKLIATGLPGAQVDVVGDGHHFEAVVVSESFAGKSTLARHQMVYRTLGTKMGNEIHALSIKALAPGE
jgi:acid stress-induced BolA-like protein IbaG/YrbA